MEGAAEDTLAAEHAAAGEPAAEQHAQEVTDATQPPGQEPPGSMPPPLARSKQPMGAPPARESAQPREALPLQPPVAAQQASGEPQRRVISTIALDNRQAVRLAPQACTTGFLNAMSQSVAWRVVAA